MSEDSGERTSAQTAEDARLVALRREFLRWLDAENENDPVLGRCPHGVDLDREFCPKGCRV